MSRAVAAIDCGTNSIRLLIARRDPATGAMVELDRRLEMVRLGYGVDRTGRFDPTPWSGPSPPHAATPS